MDEEEILEIKNYIGGDFIGGHRGDFLDVFEPATGRQFASAPLSDASDVDMAVEAARNAQPSWGSLEIRERADWLDRIAGALEGRHEEVASLESRDTGKPISLARSVDATRSVSNFRFFAEMLRNQDQEVFEMSDASNFVVNKPVGVGALITPWNLPLYLLSWKIAPAIGMGNAVVCKPSELTPMTADLLMGVLDEIGLPGGVVNLVHGDGSGAGAPLVSHPGVDFVSFTGGTSTGGKVAASAAPSFKKLSLELGGKNSSIVFSDCDMQSAVSGVARAGFLNQGQVCLCGSRILVEGSIYGEFRERFVRHVEQMNVGDPSNEGTELGALISQEHFEKVLGYVELAKEEGGKILTGGSRCSPDGFENGNWMLPTVIEGVGADSRCATEEIFGPLVTLHSFESEEEALEIANNTRYGLAGSVWTGDLERGRSFSEKMETGMVWVNSWLHRDLRAPFGGVKDSGVGREGGRWSLGFFSEAMNVCVKRD